MPKQITVEADAMAYDREAVQDSRMLQPLRLDQVTITAGSDGEAIVLALGAAANTADAALGGGVQLVREVELGLEVRDRFINGRR
jgi:hypothetical protein